MKSKSRAIEYIMLAAITIDGKIARGHDHFSGWTSPEDKQFLHDELDKSDCVIVGNNTYETAKDPLSKRKCIVFTRSVAGMKDVSPNLIYCNPQDQDLLQLLQRLNCRRVAVLGGTETYNYFLERGLIDVLHLTIEPIVFGGGLGLFDSLQPQDVRFVLESVKNLNNNGSLLLTYTRP